MNSTNDLQKLPVEELIALMADQSHESHHNERIFNEFHRRFASYAYTVARRSMATKVVFDDYECAVIVHNCLLAIRAKAGVFVGAAEGIPEKEKHKRVLGWVSTIIHNGVTQYAINQDKLKKRTIFVENIDDYLNTVTAVSPATVEESPPTANMLKLADAISKIRKDHYEITATYIFWEDENGDIPPDILARLNARYHLLPKYAGKIVNRTIEKLFKINQFTDLDTQYEVETAKSRREKIRGIIKEIPPCDWEDFPGNTGTS